MRVRLEASCSENEILAVCQIRHIELRASLEQKSKRWHVGLEIVEISAEDAELLRDYCTRLTETNLHERHAGFAVK